MKKTKLRRGITASKEWPSSANKRTYYLGATLVNGIAARAITHHDGNESKAAQEIVRAGLKAISGADK